VPVRQALSFQLGKEDEVMKKILLPIAITGTSFLVLMLSAFVVPEIVCILLSLMFAAALIVLLIVVSKKGITDWRRTSNWWMVLPLVCLALLFIGSQLVPSIGRGISDRLFLRRLGSYNKVVDDFSAGRISCASSCDGKLGPLEVTTGPSRIQDILAAHCDDGGAIVLFRLNTDVPLLHHGIFLGISGKAAIVKDNQYRQSWAGRMCRM
jgi:hypothetical protein